MQTLGEHELPIRPTAGKPGGFSAAGMASSVNFICRYTEITLFYCIMPIVRFMGMFENVCGCICLNKTAANSPGSGAGGIVKLIRPFERIIRP